MSHSHYLVVGGSSGIGLAVTTLLSQRGHGVTVVSRSRDSLPDNLDVEHISLDVLTEDLPSDRLPTSLDGLVYCPGSINLKPFQRLSDDDFRRDIEINLIGAVRCLRSALTAMKKAPDGSSLVLFSTVAVSQGLPFHASVASAKGAVEGLVRALAAELAPSIRVNAVAPSLTATPMAAQLIANDAKRQAAADRHPLRRIGTPDDIAASVLHLLEPSGSWVTGQILHVDGGFSTLRTG